MLPQESEAWVFAAWARGTLSKGLKAKELGSSEEWNVSELKQGHRWTGFVERDGGFYAKAL